MGDPVNQAARFEPANKDYGTLIVIGETTYEAAKEHIEVRLLDKLIVKGKTKPIAVYELLGRKGEIEEKRGQVASLYETALKAHWDRKWDAAESALNQALTLDQHDGPCARLLKRVNDYRIAPPEDSWSGEFIRATKD
jgi:adenylate cyclase